MKNFKPLQIVSLLLLTSTLLLGLKPEVTISDTPAQIETFSDLDDPDENIVPIRP